MYLCLDLFYTYKLILVLSQRVIIFWTDLMPTSGIIINFPAAVEIKCFKKSLNLNRSVVWIMNVNYFRIKHEYNFYLYVRVKMTG